MGRGVTWRDQIEQRRICRVRSLERRGGTTSVLVSLDDFPLRPPPRLEELAACDHRVH